MALHFQDPKTRVRLLDVFSGTSNWVRINPVDPKAWYSEVRSERRLLSRTELRVRVGTKSDGSIQWATFPMIMHREIPAEADIKWVVVTRHKVGPREFWTCEITVKEPELNVQAPSGVMAIRLGWKKQPNGTLVVGECLDTTGRRSLITMDSEIIEGIIEADRIRKVRDLEFDAAKAALLKELENLEGVPEWLTQQTKTLHLWKSKNRLAGVALKWRHSRFDGDEFVYEALEAWRFHDHHLWEWELNQRKKSSRRRLDGYRNSAVKLTEKYGKILIVHLDLERVARSRPVESEDGEAKRVRVLRANAATSELRNSIIHAVRLRNGTVLEDVKKVPYLSPNPDKCPACGCEDEAQVNKDEGTFACTSCPYFTDRPGAILMNLLRDDGYGVEVDAMIEREREIVQRLKGQFVEIQTQVQAQV